MQNILEGYAAAATPSFVVAYDALSPERIYEHVIDFSPNVLRRWLTLGQARAGTLPGLPTRDIKYWR